MLVEDPLSAAAAWRACEPEARQAAAARLASATLELIEVPSSGPAGPVFEHAPTGIALVLVPGGPGIIGDDQGDADERPRRRVQVPSFFLAREPLSQQAWDALGGVDDRAWADPELPICGLSWDGAADWLRRAGLRFPGEMEWEYACRAGSTGAYFWGEAMDPSRCWYGGNAFDVLRPKANWEHDDAGNAFGLIDMAGNVFEWCRDPWVSGYRDLEPDGSRPAKGNPRLRVARGGAWDDHCDHCRSAFRFKADRTVCQRDFGLRPALSVGPHEVGD